MLQIVYIILSPTKCGPLSKAICQREALSQSVNMEMQLAKKMGFTAKGGEGVLGAFWRARKRRLPAGLVGSSQRNEKGFLLGGGRKQSKLPGQ